MRHKHTRHTKHTYTYYIPYTTYTHPPNEDEQKLAALSHARGEAALLSSPSQQRIFCLPVLRAIVVARVSLSVPGAVGKIPLRRCVIKIAKCSLVRSPFPQLAVAAVMRIYFRAFLYSLPRAHACVRIPKEKDLRLWGRSVGDKKGMHILAYTTTKCCISNVVSVRFGFKDANARASTHSRIMGERVCVLG